MAKIVIIDSGIDLNNNKFKKRQISGVHFFINENGNISMDKNIDDDIGHGTAIASIISSNPDNELFIIKIFDEELDEDIRLLTYALEYVYKHIDCDIINMSVGFTEYDSLHEIKEICYKLRRDKKAIMIAAFDNNDAISFPAALDTVIGVDMSKEIYTRDEFIYLKNSVVDVLVKESMHRVMWLDNKEIMTHGTSFATSKFTALLSKKIEFDNNEKLESRIEKLAKRVIDLKVDKDEKQTSFFNIEKAIVFPVNKEIHALLRFEDDLKYTMKFYDIKYSGRVGSNTSKIIPNTEHIIKDVETINWLEDFDTIILGHCNEMSNLTKVDYIEIMLKKAIKYNKNIFAFDNLEPYNHLVNEIKNNGGNVYYPKVTRRADKNRLSKLFYISKPILAVCGTSSVQGKFTLQYMLRKKFEEKGIKVGQVGTEPTSLLLGMDDDFTIGYDSNVKIEGYDFISEANKILFDVANKNNDIIITGTQSGTIPYNYSSLQNIPLYSLEYLMAVKPDAVVLCVNVFDPVEYIKRTIKTIENLLDTHVVALSIFPINKKTNLVSKHEEEYKKEDVLHLTNAIGKKCYLMDYKQNLDDLFNDVLQYFMTPK